ncbi:hypothetical protein PF672P2_00067 [Parabacteroides phage PF672P2]|nr:hypothetical protein PF672P1_00024 [Parabacteroides phage PF672P1]WAX17204.1 hypothetical protein PF672P2_00067 [Parabacteroides phage PF672P2]
MVNIPIESHDFVKKNLYPVSRGKIVYDIYKCDCCGLEGRRYGTSKEITVKRDKILCAYAKGFRDKLTKCHVQQVIITNEYPCVAFGLLAGIEYDRVPCPKDEMDKFAEDVWVFSETRGEPVRLLPGEFKIVK